MVSFTGSTAVGRQLMRDGADTMKRTFLELGGKSALIVLDDANPAHVIPGAIGVCVHAGQACAANTRMLIHRVAVRRGRRRCHDGVRGGARR